MSRLNLMASIIKLVNLIVDIIGKNGKKLHRNILFLESLQLQQLEFLWNKVQQLLLNIIFSLIKVMGMVVLVVTG